ncbi:hypothetical protein C8R45DRAFT_918118 [Mycena sanguinolenta]|nr:hypothetical protein C8R45DRAFT_918118 [Mycena sanguinolenta]
MWCTEHAFLWFEFATRTPKVAGRPGFDSLHSSLANWAKGFCRCSDAAAAAAMCSGSLRQSTVRHMLNSGVAARLEVLSANISLRQSAALCSGKVRTCSGKPVPLQRQFHVNSGNIPLFCGKQHLQAVHAFSVAIYASIVGRHNNCQGEAVTNLTTVEALELPQSTPLRPHLLPLRTQHWLRCSSSPSSPVEDIFLRHFHQRQPTPSYC